MTQSEFVDALGALDGESLLQQAALSPAVHFTAFVEIPDKTGNVIRPIPNILQLRMSECYETCRAIGRPCYMVVCKPRQTGCSTFGAEMMYHHSMTAKVRGITISDKADSSKKLMLKVRDFSMRDQFPWGTAIKSQKTHAMEWTNGSTWEIDSAQNPRAGIGDTRQAFHASEVGKWQKTGVVADSQIMSAVLPSVGKTDSSLVIAESTPEGSAGWFANTYNKHAVTLEEFVEMDIGENAVQWIKIFAGWWEFDEHRRNVTDTEAKRILASLSIQEHEDMERFGLDVEQIAWARDILALECDGDIDLFNTYYPPDEERAWISSGRPRFNPHAVSAMARESGRHGSRTGFITLQDDLNVRPTWTDSESGDIQVWEPPMEGMRYIVSCDPATGASQTNGKDPDRTSIIVMRAGFYDPGTDCDHPPLLCARVRPPSFADAHAACGYIVSLSRFYGGALAVVESNMGLAVIELLKLAGVPLYKRRVPSARVGSTVEQIGFKITDREQRRQLVDTLAVAIREEGIRIYCPHAINELRDFTIATNGREEARVGCHDDDVFAIAEALFCLPSATEFRRTLRRRRRPADARDWRRWRG